MEASQAEAVSQKSFSTLQLFIAITRDVEEDESTKQSCLVLCMKKCLRLHGYLKSYFHSLAI